MSAIAVGALTAAIGLVTTLAAHPDPNSRQPAVTTSADAIELVCDRQDSPITHIQSSSARISPCIGTVVFSHGGMAASLREPFNQRRIITKKMAYGHLWINFVL